MSNNLMMKWKSTQRRRIQPAAAPRPDVQMTDAQLTLLANRYQANRICYLLDITFGAYLLAPKGWDRIAKHLEDGGGCRIEAGQLILNGEPGHA